MLDNDFEEFCLSNGLNANNQSIYENIDGTNRSNVSPVEPRLGFTEEQGKYYIVFNICFEQKINNTFLN